MTKMHGVNSVEFTESIFSRKTILENYDSALIAISFAFVNSFSKIIFNKKKLMLRIDSAASSGGQEKLTYSKYFPWPPLEAGV
jgi:hypothetical protein